MKPSQPLTLDMYLTANGRYKDRAKHKELTLELLKNAEVLITAVNQLLTELKVSKVDVSSGFRPTDVNKAVPNASKKSAHQICMAVDLVDDKAQTLAKRLEDDFKANGDKSLLVKYELYLESPKHTMGKQVGWVHLQTRPTRNRIFIP